MSVLERKNIVALAALLLAARDEVPVPHCADIRPTDLASTAPVATTLDLGELGDGGSGDGGADAVNLAQRCCVE